MLNVLNTSTKNTFTHIALVLVYWLSFFFLF